MKTLEQIRNIITSKYRKTDTHFYEGWEDMMANLFSKNTERSRNSIIARHDEVIAYFGYEVIRNECKRMLEYATEDKSLIKELQKRIEDSAFNQHKIVADTD